MTGRERLLDELRPVAFAIAYRMLGSASEAEDVGQEALLRVYAVAVPLPLLPPAGLLQVAQVGRVPNLDPSRPTPPG